MHHPPTELLSRMLGPSRAFRALLAAALSDDLAKGIATFLLPIAAISLSTNAVHVAAVTVSLTVPWLIVGPIAGLVVDRVDRRSLLVGAELVRLMALGLLAIALIADRSSLPLLYAVAVVIGTTETLIEPALIASIPETTPRSWLEAANARLVGGRTITDNSSQTIAGALVSIGIGLAAIIAAFGFAVASLGFRRMRRTPARRDVLHEGGGSAGVREVGKEIAAGVRIILAMEPLRTITVASAVINACWAAWWSVWALYAIAPGPVGLSPFGLGLLLACGVVSSLAGATFALPIQRRIGRRWAIGINILGNVALFGITAATSAVWPIVIAILLGEFGAAGWAIATNTWQHRHVPEALRGRVASSYRVIGFGAKAIGAAAGGVLAAWLGIPALYLLCAVATLVTLVPFFRHVTEARMSGGTSELTQIGRRSQN